MTDQATPSTQGRLRGEHLLVLAVVAMVLIALFYMQSQRQQALRSSPTGLNGLQTWLAAEGQSAQSFTGGWGIEIDTVGLWVVPLYDTALDRPRKAPKTKEDLLLQQDEYELFANTLAAKIRSVQTLVILPKWRSGVRLTGIAHPVLLSETARVESTLQTVISDPGARLIRSRVPFVDFAYPGDAGLQAKIYAAQVFTSDKCAPVIGRPDAMLLASCAWGDESVLILSDPDLVNNHGLRLGDNARIVSTLFADLADERNIVIDYNPSYWLRDWSEVEHRDRSWSDLARFFSPPFTLLWIAGGLLLVLVLWRSAIRFGPVIGTAIGLSASKIQAVAARARLMRLAGQDGAMLDDYASVRIAALGADLYGVRHAGHFANEQNFLAYVKRKHPDQVVPLLDALNALRSVPHRIPAGRAMELVDQLERVLEQISNET